MNWTAILPELYFSAVAAVFFVLTMVGRVSSHRVYGAAVALTGLGIIATVLSVHAEGSLFSQAYRVDSFSQALKVLISIGLFLMVSLCRDVDVPAGEQPEFYFLLTTCTLGMVCLVSSVELLTLYVALELTSYSLYVLVPLRSQKSGVRSQEARGRTASLGGPLRSEVRGQQTEVRSQDAPQGTRDYGQKASDLATEAGLKYFLIGATTSAVMLFGLACLFGATGTTYVKELARMMPSWIGTPMGFVGLLFTLSGFFFKLAFFPFHVWGPTVYEAASDQVTTFIATTTKLMAIAVVTRIVAMGGGSESLARLLLILSIASMTFGNLAALVQKDMKRLLAYSAISHAGYVLIGILSMTPRGYTAALFYAAAYLAMTYLCFLVIVKISVGGRNLLLQDLAGLHRRSPLLAMALMAGVFSLGGIPPTIGFTGKFLVFTAAMERGHFLLVLIAMANVAVSLYYYIQIIRAAYLLEPQEELGKVPLSAFGRSVTVVLVLFTVAGGIYPRFLYDLAATAAGVLP